MYLIIVHIKLQLEFPYSQMFLPFFDEDLTSLLEPCNNCGNCDCLFPQLRQSLEVLKNKKILKTGFLSSSLLEANEFWHLMSI